MQAGPMLLDLLFPPASADPEAGAWLTAEHLAAVAALRPLREEAPTPHLDRLVAAGSYRASEGVRRALHLLKYRRASRLAACFGGALDRAADLLPAGERTLCPVPLHWTRLYDRGFNQSLLLALALSARRGWRVAELLRRVRATGHQADRGREQRLHAMLGAFRVEGGAMPASVLLVDDVATTLSTLDACASALKLRGVRTVEAIVVARR